MRWYDLTTKDLQIAGTRPKAGSIPVFFDEDDYNLNYDPKTMDLYFISEVKEGINPGERWLKFRDDIDPEKAFIIQINITDKTIPGVFPKAVEMHKNARPQKWI